MKTLISLLLTLVIILNLSACGSKENTELGTSTQDTTQILQPTESPIVQGQQSYTGTVSTITDTTLTISTDSGELSFTLTDSTLYAREFGRGGQRLENMGQMPEGMGEPPAMPSDGEQAPQQGQQPPAMPSDGGQAPQQEQQPPVMPSDGGQAPQQGQQPPTEGVSNTGDSTTGGFTPGNGTQGGMPGGEFSGGGMQPGMPGDEAPMPGEPQTITREEIQIGDTVTVEADDNSNAILVTVAGKKPDGMGGPDGQMGFPGGMGSKVESYAALTELSTNTELKDQELRSTAKDENAVHVLQGAEAALENITLVRDSADSSGGDQASFYGVGAAALVTDGTLKLSHSRIDTNAPGGTGVFAYGQGTAQVWDTEIHTSKNTSGGIHVAGGGTLHAWDLTVETQGESSAAIRSDRGSGTMIVDGGSYTSKGKGSPAIYSTADITVHNAQLTATGSEAICIEGLNSIRLYDCDLKGNMADLSQNDCTWNVILYQSMSGDSEIGNSTFEMVGGTLTAGNGGMFYTTNTESTFLLSKVAITYAEENDFFLRCTGNTNQRGWGSSGNNGASCRFLAKEQAMEGNVIWDRISQLELTLIEGSELCGAVLREDTYAQGTGSATLSIDESSTWIVTADSHVSHLHCSGRIVDAEGNSVTIMSEDGTIFVQGSGSLTVFVDSYDTRLPDSDLQFQSWEHFAVQKPTEE
ncbi:MAG: hypothetical protein J6K89_05745 [Oscillospiraceae bacterium]|nr:hypothetical protein [Oscillospiraceae bacterium]